MEFLGDSITQGVRAVGPQIGVTGSDAVRDYAWLSGTALGGNFVQVGFGAQGITRPGGGGVPAAPATLGLNYAGSPVDPDAVPAAVVVNQGTNDALNGVSSADFAPAYTAYLRDIRSRWPHAWIFAVRPFGGYFAPEIAAAVHSVADPRVIYVDTTGWVPPTQLTDDLHPTVVGHRTVARLLTRVVARTTGWKAAAIPSGHAPLAAAGARPGFEGSRAAAWRRGSHVRTVAANTTGDPYQGRRALQVTSTSAPLGEWRTIKLRSGQRVPLPRRAKNVYAYVSVPGGDVKAFDVRVRAVRNGRVHTADGVRHPQPRRVPPVGSGLGRRPGTRGADRALHQRARRRLEHLRPPGLRRRRHRLDRRAYRQPVLGPSPRRGLSRPRALRLWLLGGGRCGDDH